MSASQTTKQKSLTPSEKAQKQFFVNLHAIAGFKLSDPRVVQVQKLHADNVHLKLPTGEDRDELASLHTRKRSCGPVNLDWVLATICL